MAGLIISPYGQQHSAQRREFRLPPIEIPAQLTEDFVVNPHLERQFYIAVAKAVNRSFNDPDTSVHEITEGTLKERIETCYRAMVILRHDMRFPLRKCFDLLADKLSESIREGRRIEDLAEETSSSTAWTRDALPERTVVDTSADMNEEQHQCEERKSETR